MTEKRARVAEGDLKSQAGQRAPKILRRINEPEAGAIPRRSNRATNNPLAYRHRQEISTSVEAEDDDNADYRSGTGQEEEEFVVENNEEEDVIRVLTRSLPLAKGKQRAQVAPINWMKG